jgi:hypothetical protein
VEVTNYAVYNENRDLIGYINRQGEDSRFVDIEDGDRLRSFFPWKSVLAWTNENDYTLKRLETAEPVAVLNE